ncbi:MAG: hypothetical protein KTR26_13875, partial [Flammeovirgaceae bacterium]|nr:hypothetical protein [Flammeovirgaceae bacterium]
SIQSLKGLIQTADISDNSEVEKILSASLNGNSLEIIWNHEGGGNIHNFSVENIIRSEDEGKVELSWNGSPIGADYIDSEEIIIPALGDFKLIENKVIQTPDQYIILRFSDPIQENQNLNGLITIEGISNLKFQVKGNEIRIFPSVRQTGASKVLLFPGIKNSQGFKLKNEVSVPVVFAQIKPAVKIVEKGTVLPSTKGLVLPFEAVGLNAVQVQVIKIKEENVAQFLQVNDLRGRSEIKRVGRPIISRTIALNNTGNVDASSWKKYSIDLSQLIENEPGAIYQIKLGFKKDHVSYYCDGANIGNENPLTLAEDNLSQLEEKYDRNYYNYYDDDYYYYYDWEHRDDPCYDAYYGGNRSAQINVLASDLGIIAKRGNGGEMVVAVTDLKTTQPIQGVDLQVFNYQNGLIADAKTDENGMAQLATKSKPFLLVAKSGNQKGYVKLDDASSLSISNFDVSGNEVKKGLKGYIYGERGVWRPGDSLHITFVLEDKDQILPENHPVIFQLHNPEGQIIEKIVKAQGLNGFYNFTTSTDSEAPTGNWLARVLVGGTEFTKSLKIETVKPNRLKINLDFGKDKITANDDQVKGDLEVKWLHGAIAPNLKAEFEVDLTQAVTKFQKYPAYNFDDDGRTFSGESQTIFDGRLDANGKATINASLNIEETAPGMLMANFSGKVFEEGGDFSVDRFKIPYYPYKSFAGMQLPESDSWSRLFYDKTNSIDIVTVTPDGVPVAREGVEIEVYRLQWRWWWNRNDEQIANYLNRQNKISAASGRIDTGADGKGSFQFDLNNWGRYYVRVCDPVSGHCTGEIHYTSWGGNSEDVPGGTTMLTFSADEENYEVGQSVKLNIPGSKTGRALISVENGRKVLETFWLETQEGANEFSFEVTPEMAPNIYVHVELIQPHLQTANDLPIRLYGVIPIVIDNPATHLEPVLEMPDVLAPEKEFKITVSEAANKSMTYTVAVVDEGLLDLTRFKTPDLWNYFYAREALGVKTWDLYKDVMGAFSGSMGRLLALGGDESGDMQKNAKANRFKPVVKYLGPFKLEAGESNEHTIRLPKYIGSVKTMIVAGENGAYGLTDKATPVRQELMVLATLPRVLGPEEKVALPVNIFTLDESVKTVDIQIKTNSLLNISGGGKQQVTFDKPGEKLVFFDLSVNPGIGIGKVEVVATSENKKATYEVELDVRNPNPPVTDVIDGVVNPGESVTLNYAPVGIPGTNSGVLEVSSIPAINLGKRLNYLIRYPYGCIEQTTSSVFPQLVLAEILDLPEDKKIQIEKNVKDGIKRLQTFQNNDGGLSYWPGQYDSNEWGTNYAFHFLVEAEKRGYSVPSSFKSNIRRYLKKSAQSWRPNPNYGRDDLIQAYRLYTLALDKSAETGAMNRLRESNSLSTQAKWRLAAAYYLSGKNDAGDELIANLSTIVKDYRELSYTYGSSSRDEAMILETIALMEDKTKGIDLIRKIAGRLSENRWMSTQTTAYCLIAIAKYAGTDKNGGGMEFSFDINAQGNEKATTGLSIIQKDLGIKGSEKGKVVIKNDGKGMLFTRLILEGTPAKGDQSEAKNNLNLSVNYTDKDGKTIDPAKIDQGTDFIAVVTVHNPGTRGDYKEMVLNQIFPSGWEILNSRMDGTNTLEGSDQPTYQDIRDDRVYTFYDLRQNEKKTFKIRLNASYAGQYYLPTIYSEAMYDNTINARKPGKVVYVQRLTGQ